MVYLLFDELNRAAYTTIRNLQPFLNLFSIFVDGEGFLNIGSYLALVIPFFSNLALDLFTVTKLCSVLYQLGNHKLDRLQSQKMVTCRLESLLFSFHAEHSIYS